MLSYPRALSYLLVDPQPCVLLFLCFLLKNIFLHLQPLSSNLYMRGHVLVLDPDNMVLALLVGAGCSCASAACPFRPKAQWGGIVLVFSSLSSDVTSCTSVLGVAAGT